MAIIEPDANQTNVSISACSHLFIYLFTYSSNTLNTPTATLHTQKAAAGSLPRRTHKLVKKYSFQGYVKNAGS